MKKRIVVFGGCGTVGQRVRDAISKQDDMEVFAIVTRSPKENVQLPYSRGIPIYTSDNKYIEGFKQLGIQSKKLEDLLKIRDSFDVVIDCTDDGVGRINLEKYYKPNDIKAIFQGGEKEDIAQVSFNSLCNYEDAINKNYIRVVSCNTTGASRVLRVLDVNYSIIKAYGMLDRRGNDPHQEGKLPRGSQSTIECNSHHSKDIVTVIKNLTEKIKTDAKKVDKQEFHSHIWTIDLEKEVSLDELKSLFRTSTRIITLSDKFMFKDDGKIKFYVKDSARLGQGTGDIYETLVWPEEFISTEKCIYPIEKFGGTIIEATSGNAGVRFISLSGENLYKCNEGTRVSFQILVDQQSIVVPETVDAVRAMFNMASKQESIEKTNKSLGIK